MHPLLLASALAMTLCASRPQIVQQLRATTAVTTVAELEVTLGAPARDIGSGIHIYVYPIDGGGEVRVGSADGATVLYIRLRENGHDTVLFRR